MRTTLIRLHRRLSVIIAVPVLLWASSGFMHPIMTNIRHAVATQGIQPVAIDAGRIRYPLGRACIVKIQGRLRRWWWSL